MRLRWAISLKHALLGIAATAVVLALGMVERTSYESCHLCHNRRVVRSRLVFALTLSGREAATTAFPVARVHRHAWSRYSRRETGLLRGAIACRAFIYADRSVAPDGYR